MVLLLLLVCKSSRQCKTNKAVHSHYITLLPLTKSSASSLIRMRLVLYMLTQSLDMSGTQQQSRAYRWCSSEWSKPFSWYFSNQHLPVTRKA